MRKRHRQTRYHGPLITNPVVLGYIKLYPWIALGLSLIFYVATKNSDNMGIAKYVSLFCFVISILSILISLSNWMINHLKSFVFILISLVTIVILFNLDFIGWAMFVGDGELKSLVYSISSLFYLSLMGMLFIVMVLVYSWYYLPKNQGKVWAFNQEKSGSKKQRWLSNFGVAIAGAIVLPSFLTGYIQNIFGLFLGVLLTTTLPAVIVDAIYAAYYVRKYPGSEELF